MSNRVFKNYQINMGTPFQVRNPLNAYNIKTVRSLEEMNSEVLKDEINSSNQVYADIKNSAHDEAEIVLREAELEALRIVSEAEKTVDEFKASIEAEARKKGYEEGTSEAKKQYEDLMNEAEFIKEHAKAEYKEVLTGIEEEAVSMILEIARKVIGDEIKHNRESIVHVVRQAIEKCTNKEDVKVRLSPDDCEYLTENIESLTSKIEGLGEIEFKRDSSLKEGDCILETSYGSIDAGVDTKFKKIEEEFLDAIDKE